MPVSLTAAATEPPLQSRPSVPITAEQNTQRAVIGPGGSGRVSRAAGGEAETRLPVPSSRRKDWAVPRFRTPAFLPIPPAHATAGAAPLRAVPRRGRRAAGITGTPRRKGRGRFCGVSAENQDFEKNPGKIETIQAINYHRNRTACKAKSYFITGHSYTEIHLLHWGVLLLLHP